jgi:hypothetical protein
MTREELIEKIGQAIAEMEGFYRTAAQPTLARRNANPGNIRQWRDSRGRPYPTSKGYVDFVAWPTQWWSLGHAKRCAPNDTQDHRAVTIRYSHPREHDLCLGTWLGRDAGRIEVAIDGGAPVVHDLYLNDYNGLAAMKRLATALPGGTHTVEIRALFEKHPSSNGYYFYFDYLWPLEPQDPPEPPQIYTDVSAAIDFDTDHGYKKPPAWHVWHLKQLGFLGHADVYMGVFWNNKRRRIEATYPNCSVSIGAWEPDEPLWINLSGTTLYFSPGAGLATEDIAAHLRAMINVTFPGVWCTSDGGSVHIRSRAPSYTFTISASPQLSISHGTPPLDQPGVSEQFLFGVVDATNDAVIGRHNAAGHLLEAQKLDHRVGCGHGAVEHARNEVFFEIAVDARRFHRQIALVSHMGLRRQVQHFLAHPERDAAHQLFELVEPLKVHDLLALVASHNRVLLAEGREGWSIDPDIQEAEDGVDIHRAVRHWSAGERDAIFRMRAQALEGERRLAARRFDAVGFVRDDQIPRDLLSPGGERVAPHRVVVDDADKGPAQGLGELQFLGREFLLVGDRSHVFVERDHDHFDPAVALDLLKPDRYDAERRNDHDPARPEVQDQHDGDERLASAHSHGQQKAMEPGDELAEAKFVRGDLMPPGAS